MTREPHKAIKKDPDAIQPAPRPGPSYDPMDRIIQDLQNIQSFIAHLSENPEDLPYLDTHLSKILGLRRTIAQQIEQLSEEPYNYSLARLKLLKKENERIFSYVEGAVGAVLKPHRAELKRFVAACEKSLSKFEGDLTP